jgi:hypothetical protein
VERAGRCFVCEVDDRAGDPAPDRRTFMLAGGLELVRARGALGLGLVAIALQHELRRPSYVDLGYHSGIGWTAAVEKGLR